MMLDQHESNLKLSDAVMWMPTGTIRAECRLAQVKLNLKRAMPLHRASSMLRIIL